MKKIYVIALSLLLNFLFANCAKAVCPVCTIAVSCCVGLSRWLGIDDTITGLWIGGLIVSLIVWTIDWLNKKEIAFKGRKIIIAWGYYLIIIVPLYFMGIIGHPLNVLWGIDKLILGIAVGSIFFSFSSGLYAYLKNSNNGKPYFPYQKVVMPIFTLALLSLFFYYLTK